MTEKKDTNLKRKRRNKKVSKGRKGLKIFSIIMLFLVLTAIVTAAGYTFAIIKSTDNINLAEIQNLAEPAQFYGTDGQKIDTLLTDKQRFKLTSDQIPQHLKDAYVSIEDERFYSHPGIDIRRIGGAIIHDIEYFITKKGGLHGASTLTQQLIKNTVLNDEVKIERKVKEIYLSLQLEKQLSKDEILTAYLNTIPLGSVVYGVEAASLRFFNKGADELNLIESAYLAGITQAPSSYDAFSEKNQKDPSSYLNRTKTVLGKMFELGKISQEEYDNAIKDINDGKLVFHYTPPSNSLKYEWFTRAAIDQIEKDLQKKAGYSEEEAKRLLRQGGLKIYTTMDEKLQNEVQSIIDDRSNLGVPGTDTTNEYGTPLLQASAVIKDYKTGEIKAMVGGRGDQPPMSLNRAYSVLKPTGSTTKPLSVYAPAIDTKILTAGSVIDDAPFEPDQRARHNGYSPNNASRTFSGNMSLSNGLAVSSNAVAAKVVDKIGINNAVAYGKKFGLIYNSVSEKSLTAAALGQFDNSPQDPDGSNPYYLASAFGAFGNNGVMTEGMLYREVKDFTGKVILKANPEKTQVVSPQTAYIMYDMLKGPVQGFASIAKVPNITTVGKTGTTTDNKDYWFSGLTPYYSASVWIGYDSPTPMGSSSSKTAGRLFGKIMTVAHKGLQDKQIENPGGISKASVCLDSGLIPTALCKSDPRGSRVASYWFINGTQPKSYCDAHVSVKINTLNGKLANDNTPAALVANKVFIKKKYIHKGTNVADYQYLVPSYSDDMSSIPNIEGTNPENPDTENPEVENPEGGANGETDGGTTTPPNTGDTVTPPNTEGTTPPNSGGTTTPPANNTTPPTNNTPPPANNAVPPAA